MDGNYKIIEKTLATFGVGSKVIAIHNGYSTTRYELEVDIGTKMKQITDLEKEILQALKVKEINILAPIPEKDTVGIEIPKKETKIVSLLEMIKYIPYELKDNKLLLILGRDTLGNPIYSDLKNMPHLLIAGATGTGKSVCLNSIISTLLCRTTPDEVNLILIDTKKTEFNYYEKLPHLLAPVVINKDEVVAVLKVVLLEMELRYELMNKCFARNIEQYNEKNPKEKLPYWIIIIDELANVISDKEVEELIGKLVQLSRASGIHLILSTQRPSVNVIKGDIKNNIPSRIAFKLGSSTDTRTIFDFGGAEKLNGKGDMLFLDNGETDPIRVQGAYISENEIKRLCRLFSKVEKDKIVLEKIGNFEEESIENKIHPQFTKIKEYVLEKGEVSNAEIKGKFHMGYDKASLIIDELHAMGIIEQVEGKKKWQVVGGDDIANIRTNVTDQ